MKSSIRDKVEGTFHEVKGKIKEVTGKVNHAMKENKFLISRWYPLTVALLLIHSVSCPAIASQADKTVLKGESS